MPSTRQTLAAFEQAFLEETEADRVRQEALYHQATRRLVDRRRERAHKHGSVRFTVLVLILIATAVLVTIAMFKTLYLVMG